MSQTRKHTDSHHKQCKQITEDQKKSSFQQHSNPSIRIPFESTTSLGFSKTPLGDAAWKNIISRFNWNISGGRHRNSLHSSGGKDSKEDGNELHFES